MKIVLITLILLNFTIPVFSQTDEDIIDVVNAAVLEGYVGAFRKADLNAFNSSVHPQLYKMKVGSPSLANVFSRSTLARYMPVTPQSMDDLTWEVISITDKVAVIKIMAATLWDLVILTKHNKDWLVTAIVWNYNTLKDTGDAKTAGITAKQFVNNLYFGNEKDLATILHKRVSIIKPISANKIESVGYDDLLEQAKTKKWSSSNKNLKVETEVLAVYKSHAVVKVISKWGEEYLNMCYFEPNWYVVNGIWYRE